MAGRLRDLNSRYIFNDSKISRFQDSRISGPNLEFWNLEILEFDIAAAKIPKTASPASFTPAGLVVFH
jgi:hypothetical protein